MQQLAQLAVAPPTSASGLPSSAIGCPPGSGRIELLTARERAVLALLSEGMTAVAIAHRLAISPRTVHKHLENIYAKLGVTDRLGAVLLSSVSRMPAR
jgi:DNA-binding NarL/FixJ family response regulator